MPALLDAPAQVREQPAVAVERERHLRDEHDVGIAAGERGVAGDEAGVPAHQLDQPIPFAVDFASTVAALMASLAWENAVWKPKLWSM